MKLFILPLLLFITIHSSSQSVFGYWYGTANVKTSNAANNYLVELVLQPEKGYVKGLINYYFKNTYRSLQIKGNYNKETRQLSLYNIPIAFHGALNNMQVDCMMNLQAILQVAKTNSNLKGAFISLPEYKYTCGDVNFNLVLNADVSKQDSVLKSIREYKETYQVWSPSAYDTAKPVNVFQRKIINYVVQNEFKERQNVVANEIEVESDLINVDFYDNGEVDGDSISVFFNNELLISNQKISAAPLHFEIKLDTTKQVNELSMFADNLGSIPPNTALMIVDDGKKRIEVRLTSNFQKNALVRIKRKSTSLTSK
ncbi:MAG: hypothetical protein WDN26_11130 [Chitinophagaceae bacterium]